jgi:hypothetical protein
MPVTNYSFTSTRKQQQMFGMSSFVLVCITIKLVLTTIHPCLDLTNRAKRGIYPGFYSNPITCVYACSSSSSEPTSLVPTGASM